MSSKNENVFGTIGRFFGHLTTISRHKAMVTVACIRVGLVRQGLLHDLSKYSPQEFIPGVRYYQGGKRSPINREKEVRGQSEGWLHHKGRNPHHFEYWIDYSPNPAEGITGMKMGRRYVAEMAIDRICASRNYQKKNYTSRSAWDYYYRSRDYLIMHPDSRFLLEYLLKMTAVKGEEYAYRYMKNRLLKNPDGDYRVRNGRLLLEENENDFTVQERNCKS